MPFSATAHALCRAASSTATSGPPPTGTLQIQPAPTRYKIVVKKPGARLSDLRTGAQVRGYTDGETSVFEVLQAPRTYNAYRFE